MKKRSLILLCLALALLLASCSGYKYPDASFGSGTSSSYVARDEMAMTNSSAGEAWDMAAPEAAPAYSDVMTEESISATGLSASIGVQTDISLAEKIIYSASANIETVSFDDTLNALSEMITSFGAFIESSYESGADYASTYYGYNAYRSANYVIRIPRESFSAFTGTLSELGNLTSLSTNATNVTEQYTDVESRLTVYRTEESRLLVMLGKCDTVADMITIESTLSNVRYEIESLTSKLKNLDNQVNYSSVTLNIREVEELTPATQTHLTYGQQLLNGLGDTLKGIGGFFKDALKFLVVNSPVFAIFALIVIVAVILIRRYGKRRKPLKDGSDDNKID